MSNRFVALAGLALAAALCMDGQAFAQKAAPTVRDVKIGGKAAERLTKSLKQGTNQVVTLPTGERVFVRLKGNKIIEMFAQDGKGTKTTASNLEERKLKITGTIQICGTLFRQRVCVTITFGDSK
jgi:hypothetical protein